MKTHVILFGSAVWMLSLAAAFVAGRNHEPRAIDPAIRTPEATALMQPAGVRVHAVAEEVHSLPRMIVSTLPATGRFTALAQAAAELHSGISADEFTVLMARIPALDRPHLLRAWAEMSDDALAFALSEADGNAYSSIVTDAMLAAASARPRDLQATFAAHPDIATAQRKRVVETLVSAGQIQLAERLASGDTDAVAGYVAARLKADPALSPLSLVWRFQADRVARDAAVDAATLAMQDSPEQVRAFVTETLRSGIATPASLASAAVTMTPGEALEWLRTLQVADELKARPLVESFQTFIADSAEAGAEWLLQQPASPARDEMVLALCHRLPPEHASIAQAWAQTISAPQLREEALQFLAQ